MTVKSGAAWAGTFVTIGATGALVTPSVGPAGVLYVDGIANVAAVTISGANPYKFAVTLPALTAGQRVDMYITATISLIATAAIVASEQADTHLISDIEALVDDLESRIGTPVDLGSGATIADNLVDIEGQTDEIGIAGAGLTNVTISGLTSAALQDFFDTDSGDTYAGSVAGSVVKEIVDNSGSGGLTAAAIWANATRTLTQSAAQVADIVSGSSITIQRGDTLSAALTGLGAITGYTTLDFTVKYNKADADTSAIIRIRKNASGLNDGLIRLNGAAAATAADGSITIDSEPLGNITIALIAGDTDDLIPGQGYYYDVQKITGATVLTMTSGTFNVAADVTRLVV